MAYGPLPVVEGESRSRDLTPIAGQGAGGDLQPYPLDKAAGLQGEDGVKTRRRLAPEVREKLLEALRTGVEKGYGYIRIWRVLRESGIEISRSTATDY